MWRNKKHKKDFKGTYHFFEVKGKKERAFCLQSTDGKIVVTFESWQAAKKQNWTKEK